MTYVRTRWKYFQECWKHAQHHWVATVIATCAIAYSTWTEYVEPFVDVPEFHFHKLPVSWALVIAFAALFFVVLEGSYRLRSQTVGNDLLPSDPLIYFELIDRRSELARRTPFEAHNRGKTVAHNILIHPIELGRRIATFKEVDSLDTGDKAEIIPEVTDMGLIFKYDILNFLRHEANESNKGTAMEFTVSAFATYKNHTGKRCFKVHCEIVYYLLNDALFREHSLLSDVKPLVEIRHKGTVLFPC